MPCYCGGCVRCLKDQGRYNPYEDEVCPDCSGPLDFDCEGDETIACADENCGGVFFKDDVWENPWPTRWEIEREEA